MRYYDWYGNRSRGNRIRSEEAASNSTTQENVTDAARRLDSDRIILSPVKGPTTAGQYTSLSNWDGPTYIFGIVSLRAGFPNVRYEVLGTDSTCHGIGQLF